MKKSIFHKWSFPLAKSITVSLCPQMEQFVLQLVTIILSLLRMSVEPALHFWSPGTRLFEQFPGHMKELIVGELKVESF
jgi:hypothetical protein